MPKPAGAVVDSSVELSSHGSDSSRFDADVLEVSSSGTALCIQGAGSGLAGEACKSFIQSGAALMVSVIELSELSHGTLASNGSAPPGVL